MPFIYKPVNIFKYFNHFMLSERLFKQVKIKFCPATFQSPPISPSPFAITGLAPFRCWHAYCVSEVYLCIYNLYALSASAGWQLPSLMHLAYRSTQPPTFFPPSAPPPFRPSPFAGSALSCYRRLFYAFAQTPKRYCIVAYLAIIKYLVPFP